MLRSHEGWRRGGHVIGAPLLEHVPAVTTAFERESTHRLKDLLVLSATLPDCLPRPRELIVHPRIAEAVAVDSVRVRIQKHDRDTVSLLDRPKNVEGQLLGPFQSSFLPRRSSLSGETVDQAACALDKQPSKWFRCRPSE
jgi:hypothetical protein